MFYSNNRLRSVSFPKLAIMLYLFLALSLSLSLSPSLPHSSPPPPSIPVVPLEVRLLEVSATAHVINALVTAIPGAPKGLISFRRKANFAAKDCRFTFVSSSWVVYGIFFWGGGGGGGETADGRITYTR